MGIAAGTFGPLSGQARPCSARGRTSDRSLLIEHKHVVFDGRNCGVRADGPVPKHPWESALKELERAYRQATKLEPPTPRWSGLQLREQQDNLSRFEKLRRRKRLTEAEQAEMDRLSQDRTATPNVAGRVPS